MDWKNLEAIAEENGWSLPPDALRIAKHILLGEGAKEGSLTEYLHDRLAAFCHDDDDQVELLQRGGIPGAIESGMPQRFIFMAPASHVVEVASNGCISSLPSKLPAEILHICIPTGITVEGQTVSGFSATRTHLVGERIGILPDCVKADDQMLFLYEGMRLRTVSVELLPTTARGEVKEASVLDQVFARLYLDAIAYWQKNPGMTGNSVAEAERLASAGRMWDVERQ